MLSELELDRKERPPGAVSLLPISPPVPISPPSTPRSLLNFAGPVSPLHCPAVRCSALFHPGQCVALHLTQGSAFQEGTELSVHQQGFCLCQCQHDPAPGKTCTAYLFYSCKLIPSATEAKARMKA